jgi:Rod binding domain-containing protein
VSEINPTGQVAPKLADAAQASVRQAESNKARDAKMLKVAQQFEALFTQKLLQSLRKMVPESSMFPKGPGNTMYDHMMDSQVAEHMSKSRGTGIADFLYRQWTGKGRPVQITQEAGQRIHAVSTVDSEPTGTEVTPPSRQVLDVEVVVPHNAKESLRNELPPSGGKEKNDFFLNDCNERHVPPSGDLSHRTQEQSPLRGNTDGRKTETTNNSIGQSKSEGPGIRKAAIQSGERWRAVNQYRSAEIAQTSRHQHHLQSSGVGQTGGSEIA